jgi:type I restriction enzyme S subunit
MCPNGVEWKTFDELGAFYGGLSGKTKDDFKEGNEKFITYLNIANNPALRLDIDETVKIGSNEKQNIVQYGDALFTGSSETPDECAMSSVVTEHPEEKLYLNSFCFGFRFNSLEGICPAFYKHYFRSDHFRKAVRRTANGTTRFNVSKKEFGKLAIPLPPLEIQKKIVECLDKFSALAAELQAELQLRRKQYEYYRTQLLTPHSDCNSADKTDDAQWEWKTLGEIGEMIKGSGIQKSDFVEEGKPCIHYGQVHTFYGTFAYKNKSYISEELYAKCKKAHTGDLIIATTSEDVEACCKATAWLGDEDVAVSGDAHIYRHTQNPKYMAYLFQTEMFAQQKRRCATGAKVTRVHGDDMLKFRFPLPSLAEQERIVSILDKFEALTTSLSDGIPAEQIRQQRRYEYYRDLLLTFDRKAV